jgi:hypothetical protein
VLLVDGRDAAAEPLGCTLDGRPWDHGWMDDFRKVIKWTAIALAAVAIVDQLRRPSEERTWEGTVAGFVPYDFRMPTIERARSRWWNLDEPRLFVPQVFGLGWTVNFARLVGLLRDTARTRVA